MLGVDWGTSSLRVYRLNAQGEMLETRASGSGILTVENGRFAETLAHEAGDWIAAGEVPIVMSGMIGSRQGWVEAPYVACPAGLEEIGSALKAVDWDHQRAWIAPGLSCRDQAGVHDVMRGEEVQILGVLDELGDGSHTICLPGTHSKWARVRDGRIESFSTHMTGEVFAVLKAHSILGRMMRDGEMIESSFVNGVQRASDAGGLLHHLFGVRAQGLFRELPDTESASYLSGILIGHELRAAGMAAEKIHLLCTAQLARLYTLAANAVDIETVALDPNAVTRGLFKLAKNLPERA